MSLPRTLDHPLLEQSVSHLLFRASTIPPPDYKKRVFHLSVADGVRTTWHRFFQDLALPWEYHMITPPELLQHFVPMEGLEPPRLKADAPKASMSTIPPHRH